jgi:hypothetical protein
MQEAFSFLNKLQIMDDGETRNSSNREPAMSRPEHSSSAGQSGRYTQRSNPEYQIYELQRKLEF